MENIDYQGVGDHIPQVVGQAVADMISVRLPSDERWSVLVWLIRLVGSAKWHRIFLDGSGYARWCEYSEEEIEDSLDDDLVLCKSPFVEVWRGARIMTAEVVAVDGFHRWPLPAVQIYFESGYGLSFCFDDPSPESSTRLRLLLPGHCLLKISAASPESVP